MFDLSEISKVVSDIVCDYDVKRVWLFGSVARGDATDGSDVDLRFERGDLDYAAIDEIATRLEDRLGVSVDIVTCPIARLKPRFREHMLKDQVLIYAA